MYSGSGCTESTSVELSGAQGSGSNLGRGGGNAFEVTLHRLRQEPAAIGAITCTTNVRDAGFALEAMNV